MCFLVIFGDTYQRLDIGMVFLGLVEILTLSWFLVFFDVISGVFVSNDVYWGPVSNDVYWRCDLVSVFGV